MWRRRVMGWCRMGCLSLQRFRCGCGEKLLRLMVLDNVYSFANVGSYCDHLGVPQRPERCLSSTSYRFTILHASNGPSSSSKCTASCRKDTFPFINLISLIVTVSLVLILVL